MRFAKQFAISAIVAVTTPAVAAGLVAGTSVAMQNSNLRGDIYSITDNDAGPQADDASKQASHAPARLTVLVGNDKAAWDSARSVHVDFSRKPH
jgi:hypothetical protein